MKKLVIFDPNRGDKLSSFRGGGRILQILKENLSDQTRFISDLSDISDSILLIPSWSPFSPLPVNKRIASKQYLIIFDVIPLKYPAHFPAGIRGKFNLWRNKQAMKHFDKIITISEHSKKDIVKYLSINENKVAVVYPAIIKMFLENKEERIKKKENASTFHPLPSSFLLYVGDVNWNKNLVNLAKAIKLADIPCVFVGKPFGVRKTPGVEEERSDGKTPGVNLDHPWQSEFKHFLEEVGDDKRFIFLGYVEDSELVELYQNAICNVLVSRDEGFGYSYTEAASQQCPSVLSDIPVFHEIANDTALFANPKDPKDIAAKIGKFKDVAVRKSYGERAYKRLEKLSPENFKKTLLDLLEE